LTVVDFASCTRVLAGHAGRLGPFLQETGFIHHQDGLRVPHGLAHIPSQVIPHALCTPGSPIEQVLEVVRMVLSSLLGQLPTVLPLNGAQQVPDLGQGPFVRLSAGKTGAQAFSNLCQLAHPMGDFRLHHGQGWLFNSWYTFALNHGVSSSVPIMVHGSRDRHEINVLRGSLAHNWRCSTRFWCKTLGERYALPTFHHG
jgi:hypothetical protein